MFVQDETAQANTSLGCLAIKLEEAVGSFQRGSLAGTHLPVEQQGMEVVYQALLQVLPLGVTDGAARCLHPGYEVCLTI